MKRLWMAAVACLVWVMAVSAQEKKFGMYAVGFYNQENLFDTIHDEGKNDYEYLPEGAMKWNGMKYFAKLKNMSTVLAEMGQRSSACPRWKTAGCWPTSWRNPS